MTYRNINNPLFIFTVSQILFPVSNQLHKEYLLLDISNMYAAYRFQSCIYNFVLNKYSPH